MSCGNLYTAVTHTAWAVTLFLCASAHSPVGAFEELSDEQLELVTAGAAAAVSADDAFDVAFRKVLQSGATVTGRGELLIQEGYPPSAVDLSNVIISDNAQGNLSAVVNVNAANSSVNVLLNLNINVNSSVGSVDQINVTVPDGPPSPP